MSESPYSDGMSEHDQLRNCVVELNRLRGLLAECSEPQKCDWCSTWATHITYHQRKNAGLLIAYWCNKHFEERHEIGLEPEPKPKD